MGYTEEKKHAVCNQIINAVAGDVDIHRLSPTESSISEDVPVCWICLDSSGVLIAPCNCPRTAHSTCLARWQLQSAGSRRETHCEFCDRALPDWKSTLTPPHCGVNAPAIMNVNFDGRTYSFEVKPGPDGYTSFTESIRRAFSLPEDSELNITFTCDEPSTDSGSLLTLQGSGAYDAAVHCASVSAARRMATPSPSRTNSLDSTLLDRAIESLPSIEAPLTPGQSASDPRQLDAGGKRRWVGIGKRLKTALSDFVTVRQP